MNPAPQDAQSPGRVAGKLLSLNLGTSDILLNILYGVIITRRRRECTVRLQGLVLV